MRISKDSKIDFNRILLLYVQERFLYRLVNSAFRTNFVLKGGVLLFGSHQLGARPTKDLDFLVKNINHMRTNLQKIVTEIISLESNDGLEFDATSITTEEIAEDTEYRGLRIKLFCSLGQARISLQLDMVFGDVVYPEVITFSYPSLMEMDDIQIQAYSWESVIAEKFEAIVKLGDLNSRMKDFYDIYFLLNHRNFDGEALREAVRSTFENRETRLESYSYIFSQEFRESHDKQVQWKAFLRKNGMELQKSFNEIMKLIQIFIEPAVSAKLNKEKLNTTWDHVTRIWVE